MGYTLDIANEIKHQLFTMDRNLMWGLGSTNFIARTNEKNQPTLTFKVNGAQHKGLVDISYNEGQDLYEIKVYTVRKVKNSSEYKTTVKYELAEVYFDMLPDLLEAHCY